MQSYTRFSSVSAFQFPLVANVNPALNPQVTTPVGSDPANINEDPSETYLFQ